MELHGASRRSLNTMPLKIYSAPEEIFLSGSFLDFYIHEPLPFWSSFNYRYTLIIYSKNNTGISIEKLSFIIKAYCKSLAEIMFIFIHSRHVASQQQIF